MKKFLISEAEKARILGMHYNAMGKKLIKEGDEHLMTPEETKTTGLVSVTEPDEYRFESGGFNIFFETDNVDMRNKTLYYNCIKDPRDKDDNPAGHMYDKNGDPITAAQAGLRGPYINIFRKYCKTAYDWLSAYNDKNAPKAQVAAATTTKVMAPNPNTKDEVASNIAASQDRQVKRVKATQDLKSLMSASDFLDPNKDKATLDNEVNQLKQILTIVGPSSEDLRELLPKMSYLVRTKPEYGAEPFGLTELITTLKSSL